MWAALGLIAIVAALSFDYHWLERYAYLLYAVAVAMLVLWRCWEQAAAARGAGSRWARLRCNLPSSSSWRW